MAKDIEEFLKMAAARRREAQAKSAGARQPAPPAAQPAQPPPKAAPTRKSKPRTIVEADDIQIGRRKESVAQHVKSHINTSRLAEHASHLGQQVGLADDIMDARLHQTFDHDLGRLSHEAAQQAPTTTRRPSVVPLPLLANRQNIRQAIILSEILRRPAW